MGNKLSLIRLKTTLCVGEVVHIVIPTLRKVKKRTVSL